MAILRRTQKLATQLPVTDAQVASDTALGDWYVNKLVVDRKPLLLVVSSRSLLPIVIPAQDVRSLPSRLPALASHRLGRMGISAKVVAAEVGAMSPVCVAETTDRSVVGIMVDFAFMIPHYLDHGAWNEATLLSVENRLAQNPCFAGTRGRPTIFPEDATRAVLEAKWGADGSR
jgi:hypothetical protein